MNALARKQIKALTETPNMSLTQSEAEAATRMMEVLGPCLKRNYSTGRYDTTGGNKTPLGLYRTIRRMVEEDIESERKSKKS